MSQIIRTRKPIMAPQPQDLASQPQEMKEPEPQIAFSYFNTSTRQTFLKSTMRFLGHNTKVHCLKEGDIVLCYDLDQKVVFAICKLRTLDGDNIYRETHPYDEELYTGAYAKYSKYEIGVDTVKIRPTDSHTILQLSGLPEDTTLLPPCQRTSFKRTSCSIHRWIRHAIGEAWLHS